MAAAKAYSIKSVTFDGGAIAGLTDVQENETAEAITKHRTDAEIAVSNIHVDGVGMQVVVTTTDLERAAAIGIGDDGALVLVRQQRAAGKGAVAAADKTATMATTVCVNKTAGVPHEGEATAQLTFEAYDDSGAAVVVYS